MQIGKSVFFTKKTRPKPRLKNVQIKDRAYPAIKKKPRTMILSTMRYQPKALKPCCLMDCIRKRMAKIETAKATIMPTGRMPSSPPAKRWNLSSLISEPPNIAGMARKNVNSAAAQRPALLRDAGGFLASLAAMADPWVFGRKRGNHR